MTQKKRRNYMAQADTLFAKIVKARDGHCVKCGSRDYLQCAHIISRDYKSIRCDLGNAMTLCRSCHMHYTHRPLEWEQWVNDTFGGLYERLKQTALQNIADGVRVDWKATLTDLRDEAERWQL